MPHTLYAVLNHKRDGQELSGRFVAMFLGLYGGCLALTGSILSG